MILENMRELIDEKIDTKLSKCIYIYYLYKA